MNLITAPDGFDCRALCCAFKLSAEMAIASKRQRALRAKFRDWLRTELAQIHLRLDELDREISKHPYRFGVTPLIASEIMKCDLSSLLPCDSSDATRLGMLHQARKHHETRQWMVSCALNENASHVEMLYQEFRKAHKDNEVAHRAMLQEIVGGLKDELGVERPSSGMP